MTRPQKSKPKLPTDPNSIAISSGHRKGVTPKGAPQKHRAAGVSPGKSGQKTGPKPETLILTGDWEDAVRTALSKPRPESDVRNLGVIEGARITPPKKKAAKKRR